MPQTIPAHSALLSATCLHAALYQAFPGLALPECPPCSGHKPDSPQTPLVNLPLSPQESRASLAELRALDADSLSQQLHLAVDTRNRTGLPTHEAAALARFAGTPDPGVSPESRLRQAQNLLLMIWVQEERLLDIAELSRRCARSERNLAALLNENSDETGPNVEPEDETLHLLPAWPFVLEQLSWFLPDNAVLCVTHPDLATRLRESGRLESYGDGLLGARFRFSELTRRPGVKESETLFILPQ